MSAHAAVNQSVSIVLITQPAIEHQVALRRFFRDLRAEHLYAEIVEPHAPTGRLRIAAAITDRPWPRSGIGSKTIHAVGLAMDSTDNRAMLTPVITATAQVTNVGLVGAVSRVLLDDLHERGVREVSYLVRLGEQAVERVLELVGFRPSELRATTEYDDYREYVASPDALREGLGIAEARRGDILDLALDGEEFERLSAYHFALTAATLPIVLDRERHAALLPGMLDLVATLPPGGVPPGTPGPKRVVVADPVR